MQDPLRGIILHHGFAVHIQDGIYRALVGQPERVITQALEWQICAG